jgi:type III secretion protein N (ATPase)
MSQLQPPKVFEERVAQLKALQISLPELTLAQTYGTVENIQGPLARVAAADFKVGNMCEFMMDGGKTLLGEVIGLQGKHSLVTPLGPIEGIGQGTLVRKLGKSFTFPFSNALLGRIVSGLGDGIGTPLPPEGCRPMPIRNTPPDPIDRAPIDKPLTTGLRVIDGAMTLAEGQRVALIGPPGAGKSTLLAAITANTSADVAVLAGVPLAVATVVGLVVSFLQAITQIQDQTLSQTAKMVAIAATFIAMGGFLIAPLIEATVLLFDTFWQR